MGSLISSMSKSSQKRKSKSKPKKKISRKKTPSLNNLQKRLNSLHSKTMTRKELNDFVKEWKKKVMIPFLKDKDSYELFIRKYESKLLATCGLKKAQVDKLLKLAIHYDETEEDLVKCLDNFTKDFIGICGFETIDCLGI